MLDVLFYQDIDAFATVSAVADLDGVAMVAQINARTLSGVIDVDVEVSSVA